jgi:hypothetical protein
MMLRLTLVNDLFNPMVTTLDFSNDFCIQWRSFRKAPDTRNEEFFQILLIFLELSRRGNFTETFLAAIKGSPYRKYSPADLALLEDPAKRQLYIEAHTGCIAPRYRDIAAILSTKSALMENPPPSYLDGVFPADGIDWTKFSQGSLSYHMFDMGAFAHAWAPLERRWEAEGAAVAMHATASYNSVAHSCLPVGWKPCG